MKRLSLLSLALLSLWIAAAGPSATVSAQSAEAATTPAADLRVMFSSALGEHVALGGFGLQKLYLGSPDVDEAAAQLDENSVMVAGMVGSLYGDAAAAQFLDLWRGHNQLYMDYTIALRDGDDAGMEQAVAGLADAAAGLSTLLAAANPNLPRATLEAALTEHVDQVLTSINLFAAGDYPAVYVVLHEAHEHMLMMGTMLATGIAAQFPARFPGDPNAPAATMRNELMGLLTEHGALAMAAQMKAYDDLPDTPAALEALQLNGAMITDMVRTLYGEAAASAWSELWFAHNNAAAQYAVSLRTGDTALRNQATAVLERYIQGIPTILSGANPLLDRATVEADFRMHGMHLTQGIESYAAGDFARTYDIAHMGHEHATMQASHYAAAIAEQFGRGTGGAAQPVRLPNTGDGSCAEAAHCHE